MTSTDQPSDLIATLDSLSAQDRGLLEAAGYDLATVRELAAMPEAEGWVRSTLAVHTVAFGNGSPSEEDTENARTLLAAMPDEKERARRKARPTARSRKGLMARWAVLFALWSGLLIASMLVQFASNGWGVIFSIFGFLALAGYLNFFCGVGVNRPDRPVIVFLLMIITYVGAALTAQQTYISLEGKGADVALVSAVQSAPDSPKGNDWNCTVVLPDGSAKEMAGRCADAVGLPLGSSSPRKVDIARTTIHVTYDPHGMVAPRAGGAGKPFALFFVGAGLLTMVVGVGLGLRSTSKKA